MSGTYAVLTRKRAIILLIAFVLAICAAIVNVVVGSSGLTAQEFFDAVFNPAAVNQRIYAIVWTMRLPIAAMGLIIGASLACAGAVMQTILNNPLASPYTLGVSAGASGSFTGDGVRIIKPYHFRKLCTSCCSVCVRTACVFRHLHH